MGAFNVIALSGAEGSVLGATITAVLAAGVAVYLNAVGRKREDRNRRRDIYSEAYRTALEWCEAVYRVRRRAPDGSTDRELVGRLHDLQERIAYYEGWLTIESASLGESYRHFLAAVMRECEPLLRGSWSLPGRDPTAPTPKGEPAPDLDIAKQRFLQEVHTHLAPWWETTIRQGGSDGPA